MLLVICIKILLSMGLPIVLKHGSGKQATVELNVEEFVVCRFHPNNSVHLADAQFNSWCPVALRRRMTDQFKKLVQSNKLRK